jgi:hypothetical protein
MSKRFHILPLITFIGIFFAFIFTPGCANIVPPGGGPIDSIPPLLVKSIPNDSALNVNTSKIILQFNEYIDLKNPTEEILISPYPKKQPIVEAKLKNVNIRLKDSLLPNTTYTINFGKSITDLNEGNIQKNFEFIFSTGKYIDSNSLSGRLILAETGKVDSAMWALLHTEQEDSTVAKENPIYVTRINNRGIFNFEHLPPGKYYLYGLRDADGNKRYNQSIESFAFLDKQITIPEDTIAPNLYAFAIEKEKKRTPATNTKEDKKSKNLEYSVNLQSGFLDLLDTLSISFKDSIVNYDKNGFLLYEDTTTILKMADIIPDSSGKKIFFNSTWTPGAKYKMVIKKGAATDSSKRTIAKNDTLVFRVQEEAEYGSLRIRFNQLNLDKKPVVIFSQNDAIKYTYRLSGNEFYARLFTPGNYQISLLYDLNRNGIWDPGDYFAIPKKQPEIVYAIDKEVVVKENWDNETEITLQKDNP